MIKPLLDKEPASITVTNRTFSKAEQLAETFQHLGHVNASAMSDIDSEFDVIINSTSASLGGELPAVSPTIFASTSIAYDMMYGKGLTVFNHWALENGCAHAYDGLGMLVGQAAESFMLWRGLRPGTKQILRELRKNLEGL